MTIIPQAAHPAARTVAAIQASSDSLARIAAFIGANPDLPGRPALYDRAVLVSVSLQPDPKAAVLAWMERAVDAGALVSEYSSDRYAGIDLHFGAEHIQVYADADLLGEPVPIHVVQKHWRLSIEIPSHARRDEQLVGGA